MLNVSVFWLICSVLLFLCGNLFCFPSSPLCRYQRPWKTLGWETCRIKLTCIRETGLEENFPFDYPPCYGRRYQTSFFPNLWVFTICACSKPASFLFLCLTLGLSKYNTVKQGRAGHKLIPPNPIMKITKLWSWYSSRSACYSLFFKFKKKQPYFTYISISLLAPSSCHILNYQTRSKKCLSIIFSPVEYLTSPMFWIFFSPFTPKWFHSLD